MTDVPVETAVDEAFNEFDAPMSTKEEVLARVDRGTVGGTVSEPGQSSAVGGGERKARRVADTAGEDSHLRHNWVPAGPRNVGGRIRALVVHPTTRTTMYAGSASGGVWKTIDGAQSWFPLWHDEPSLAVSALSICTADPAVIWAATGEHRHSSGAGIWRSGDNGEQWSNPATPKVPGTAPALGTSFEALAAHPANANRCWAVGENGIFRTADGGATWLQFRAGEHWSDVVYSTNSAGGLTLFLVRAVSDAGEASVVFLPNPDDTEANIRVILPAVGTALPAAHVSQVIAPPPPAPPAPPPAPAAGKIAVAAAAPNLAYVRFASVPTPPAGGGDPVDGHLGVFRSSNARPAPASTGNSITWTQLVDSPDFAGEGQGDYNLTMAATPDGQNIATGMIDLHVLTSAHTAPAATPPPPPPNPWRKAIGWQIWATDRSQHADQHATLFAPDPAAPATLLLWAGNDGGISVSRNWPTGTGHAARPVIPIPATAIQWEKRSEGLLATQMYDLSQSPVVPGMVGCGFQDNGVFISGGGPTWQLVMGADGGYLAFDPDDPYRFLATWQSGIVEIHVPGLLRQIVQPVGSSAQPWPRVLQTGFSGADPAQFVAETVHHPSQGRKVFHARHNVLYSRTGSGGERWQPEPLGRGIELRHEVQAPTATLEVLPCSAAGALGLVPQVSRRARAGRTAVARCHALLHGPYRLADGDQLRFRVDGGAVQTVSFRLAGFADIGAASAAEVAAAVNAVAPRLGQAVCFDRALTAHLVVRAPASNLILGGSAAADLTVPSGTIRADAGHHAFVTLSCHGTDLRGGQLTVQVGGGTAVAIAMDDLERPQFVTAADLVRLLRRRLDSALVGVGLHDLNARVRATRVGAGTVTIAGTAANLTWSPAPPAPSVVTANDPFGLLNAPAWTLIVGDGANTATTTFNAAAGIADLSLVNAHELRRAVAAAIAAAAPAPAVTVGIDLDVQEGGVTELAFSAGDPAHVWAGDTTGMLYRSVDGGGRWQPIEAPEVTDRLRKVEAIAVHPTEPERVLVGLAGRTRNQDDPGFLFRTTNGGGSWSHVGGDVKDGDGHLVGINALEVDPDAPDVVWAATDVGVFRSGSFGGGWVPYNQGLPNTEVIDLVFEPVTHTLKAGLWGRGVYERHVGTREARDVSLLVRSNPLDDGSRPPVRGADVLAVTPGPVPGGSPDIKVTRRVAAAAGALIDGVELDERIIHEPPAEGPSTVCVQVHNRGPFPSRNVRVTAVWAPLLGGRPPALPAPLFTARAAGTMAVNSVHGVWTVIGDRTIPADGVDHDVVAASQPRVLPLPYTWTAAATASRRLAIVAIVSGDGDTDLPSDGDVERLAAGSTKIAWRETETLTRVDDRVIVLRSTTGRPFSLANPTAPTTAAGVLGLPLGAAAAALAVGSPGPVFNLAAGAPCGFRIRMSQLATVSFAASPDIGVLAATTANEVSNVMGRDLFSQGIPVRGGTLATGPGTVVGIVGQGAARVRIAGGTAVGPLGLPLAGPLAPFKTGAGVVAPFNLSVGAPLDLQIDVEHDHEISFPVGTPDIAVLAAAQAHEVRAAINRQLEHTGIPVIAEPARVMLVVRRSITEATRGAVTGGEHVADLVISNAPVAGDVAQRALFDLVTVLGVDRAARNHESRVYLRSANLGNVPVAGARHRLWSIDPVGPPPFAPTAIGAAVNRDLGPESSAVVELRWNPGAIDAGRRLLLLVIVDQAPDRVLEPPPNFPTLDALHTFCLDNANAATRLVEISA